MGAGASAYSGEVSNAKADELKTALAKLSDAKRKQVADMLCYKGDILSASVDELKEALTILPSEKRGEIADACQEVSGDVPAYVAAFSAKLGVLIDNSSNVCDMKPIEDMEAWPNLMDFDLNKPAFMADLQTKAMLLVQTYLSTMDEPSRTYQSTQSSLDSAISTHKILVDRHKKLSDETCEFLLDFIKKRDVDGNGIVSAEEATTIASAVFKTPVENIPADMPLMVAVVGKPLAVMAEILTFNSLGVKDAKQKVEAAARELSEAREKHKAAIEDNSLARHPDLVAKTKDFKAYLDSLTGKQFAEAIAEAAKSKNNWDAIVAGQGISECDFIISEPEHVTYVTTETLIVDAGNSAVVTGTHVISTSSIKTSVDDDAVQAVVED